MFAKFFAVIILCWTWEATTAPASLMYLFNCLYGTQSLQTLFLIYIMELLEENTYSIRLTLPFLIFNKMESKYHCLL